MEWHLKAIDTLNRGWWWCSVVVALSVEFIRDLASNVLCHVDEDDVDDDDDGAKEDNQNVSLLHYSGD